MWKNSKKQCPEYNERVQFRDYYKAELHSGYFDGEEFIEIKEDGYKNFPVQDVIEWHSLQ